MKYRNITRRKLVAALGGSGIAATAGLALSTGGAVGFTETTQLRSDSIDGLYLDWRETYNGSLLTNMTDGVASPSPTGPAISLGNVLPGDWGSLSVRIRGAPDDEQDLEAEIRLVFDLMNEATLSEPGLQQFVEASLWYDTGLFEVDSFGARNGDRDFGEELVHPDAEGPLTEIDDALEDGVTLDATPNSPGETICWGGDDAVTVTFGWRFPTGQENVNAVQGDEVEFDLSFDAIQC